MSLSVAVRATASWRGSLEDAGTRRPLKLYSGQEEHGASELSLEGLPGRWDPRRSVPAQLEPLPLVACETLEKAGWLVRGSGELLQGGLVVCIDGLALAEGITLARELRNPELATVPPSKFLFALPSTGASVLGLLVGLADYQSTTAPGRLGGIQALGHALDLLELGRIERALVVALGVIGEETGSEFVSPRAGACAEARVAAAIAIEKAEAATARTGAGTWLHLGVGRGAAPEVGRRVAARAHYDEDRWATGALVEAIAENAVGPLCELAMILESIEGRTQGPAPLRIVREADWSGFGAWIDVDASDRSLRNNSESR
jgi:hypothetical protein